MNKETKVRYQIKCFAGRKAVWEHRLRSQTAEEALVEARRCLDTYHESSGIWLELWLAGERSATGWASDQLIATIRRLP